MEIFNANIKLNSNDRCQIMLVVIKSYQIRNSYYMKVNSIICFKILKKVILSFVEHNCVCVFDWKNLVFSACHISFGMHVIDNILKCFFVSFRF